jgi:hypothetical protein
MIEAGSGGFHPAIEDGSTRTGGTAAIMDACWRRRCHHRGLRRATGGWVLTGGDALDDGALNAGAG